MHLRGGELSGFLAHPFTDSGHPMRAVLGGTTLTQKSHRALDGDVMSITKQLAALEPVRDGCHRDAEQHRRFVVGQASLRVFDAHVLKVG